MSEEENVCIVCMKTFQNVYNESPPNGVPLLTKFLKFAKHYLHISPSPAIQQLITKVDGCETPRDNFCEKCELSVINPICKVYLELLSAQLRLSWELEHLGKLLENSKSADLGNNIKLQTEPLDIISVSDLEEFRSLLAQKCQLKRKKLLPKILMGSRCDGEESAFMELETEPLFEESEQVLEDPLAIDTVAPDPLGLQCDDNFKRDAEEFELAKVIKLEEFHIENDELVPDIEERGETTVSLPSTDLPSTSNSILHQLQNPQASKLNSSSECPTCGKIFQRLCNFQMHYRSRHLPVSCKLCGKTCNGNRSLTWHMNGVHRINDKGTFPCRVCAKVCETRANLKLHMRRCHKSLKCPHPNCTKAFSARNNLKQHIAAIHTPGNFPCPYCSARSFTTQKYLGIHVRKRHANPSQPDSTQPLQFFIVSS